MSPQQTIADYRIVSRLGEGGIGCRHRYQARAGRGDQGAAAPKSAGEEKWAYCACTPGREIFLPYFRPPAR